MNPETYVFLLDWKSTTYDPLLLLIKDSDVQSVIVGRTDFLRERVWTQRVCTVFGSFERPFFLHHGYLWQVEVNTCSIQIWVFFFEIEVTLLVFLKKMVRQLYS